MTAVARTAVRPVDGELAGWNPVVLAGVVAREALERAGLAPGDLDEVVVGCADPVGAAGADAARAIVLAVGWPVTVGGHVVDRGETSGAAAVQAAAASIRTGQARTVLVVGLGLCSVVPPGAAALNRTYGAPWGGVAERFAEAGGLMPGPRLAERAAAAAGIGRAELDAAAEESRRRRAEVGSQSPNPTNETVAAEPNPTNETKAETGPNPTNETVAAEPNPAIVAVAARPGDAAARGVYPGDPVAADVVRSWGDTAALPPAFDDNGLLTAATFAPPADGLAAVLLQAAEDPTAPSDAQPRATSAVLASAGASGVTRAVEGQPSPGDDPGGGGAAGDDPTGDDPTGDDPPGDDPTGGCAAGQLRSTGASGGAQVHTAALATVAGMGRAAGDPFDPTGNVAVAVGRALDEAGVELGAIDDIAVVEHDAATVTLVARALGIEGERINRSGGSVATGNSGAAEELRLITDGLTMPAAAGERTLLTISAGPTGSAAVLWQM